ncbi:MAG: chromate transporter [Oscillospiraceae bacterium]|nr:chromate transporter [Oscillospiraceae bacterium]
MKKLGELFLTFFKIGLFTFGGGYAMLSVIEDNCSEKKKWITHDEMMYVTVIAESTPGPVAINCATFTGHRVAGVAGAVAATLGVILPSFIIIYAIATLLDNFLEIALVAKAFKGIKAGVSLLILSVGTNMLKKMDRGIRARIIAACAFCAMLLINIFSWNISSIVLMLLAGAVSLAIFLIGDKRKGGEAA